MWRDPAFLLDMLLSARDAQRFGHGLRFEQLETSTLHQHAIAKAVELVGEAASRISPQTQAAHPEIAWRQIIGMRNRLVHDYVHLNLNVLWDVLQRDIPALIAQLEPLVPPEDAV